MRTGRQAVAYMWRESRKGSTGFAGWCLRTCRIAWGLPSDQPSAIREWESIPLSKKSRKWWLAPVGAPHFWAGGKFGHVALQSGVKGYVWSTDAPVNDKVGKVKLGWFKKNWNYTYLGWSREFQNVQLPEPKAKKANK
jgi:hypothetical protein